MEPLNEAVFSSSEKRLESLKQSLQVNSNLEGIVIPVTLDNLIDLMLDHTGHEDVPINTWDKNDEILGLLLNIDDKIKEIADGKKVYQYIIRYTPSWIRNRRKSGSYEVPDGWIVADEIAKIKKSTTRTVNEYCRKEYINCQRFAEGDYYVFPDLKLDYWIKSIPDYGTLYQRLQYIKKAIELLPEPSVDLMFEIASNLESNDIEAKGAKGKISFDKFVRLSLGKTLPKNIDDWINRIDDLILLIKIKREEIYKIT